MEKVAVLFNTERATRQTLSLSLSCGHFATRLLGLFVCAQLRAGESAPGV